MRFVTVIGSSLGAPPAPAPERVAEATAGEDEADDREDPHEARESRRWGTQQDVVSERLCEVRTDLGVGLAVLDAADDLGADRFGCLGLRLGHRLPAADRAL